MFFQVRLVFIFFFTWFGRRANYMIMPQPVIVPEKQVPCEGIHSGAKIIVFPFFPKKVCSTVSQLVQWMAIFDFTIKNILNKGLTWWKKLLCAILKSLAAREQCFNSEKRLCLLTFWIKGAGLEKNFCNKKCRDFNKVKQKNWETSGKLCYKALEKLLGWI